MLNKTLSLDCPDNCNHGVYELENWKDDTKEYASSSERTECFALPNNPSSGCGIACRYSFNVLLEFGAHDIHVRKWLTSQISGETGSCPL
jgi:hypothetical protein